MNVATATPAQIDTEIARLQGEARGIRETLRKHYDFLHRALGHKQDRHGFWSVAREETFEAASAQLATLDLSYRSGAASTLAQIPALEEALRANDAAQTPLHDEYVARGRWTRAFLCTNAGGHVHSSQGCSTLKVTTSLVWVITADDREVSGMTEAEVVELAGEGACTVCYPSAPCTGPRRIEDPEVVASRKARQERSAELAAKRAAKGIVDPETGSELRIYVRSRGETIRTARAAAIELVDQLYWREWATSRANYDGDRDEAIRKLTVALAAKNGTTADEELAAAETRLVARKKREGR